MELRVGSTAWVRRTDVVVVGTGAAGLSAILPLVAAGVDCLAITRGEPTDSATAWAQGGLAAVWDQADSVDSHVADTLVAGAGLCDPDAVADLVASAPGALRRLIELGARFDRTVEGGYDLHLEGGHSHRRILHTDDATGAEVERALWAALQRAATGAQLLPHTRLIDVLTDDSGAACGVRVLDGEGKVGEVLASAVVLATGGLGQLWPVTTNPAIATGDGLAAALRAGAEARDLEFIQFHPTVLAERDADGRGVLLSEALRGEGAVLVDASGRRLMDGVHPLGDLAPRDVVSAAIMAHLAESGGGHVFLDLTALGGARLEHSFPGITRLVRERGYDPAVAPVPVLPAAHYSCGGIAADLWGRTSVPGLFAIGEVAGTGVHGANRLASNSLTEALVAGHRVGALLSGTLPRPGAPAPRGSAPTADPCSLTELRAAMQRNVFVARTGDALAETLASISSGGSGTGPKTRVGHRDLTASNLALAARAVTSAASLRTESRGCHRRVDHPAPAAVWESRVVITFANGHLRLTPEPIAHNERNAA